MEFENFGDDFVAALTGEDTTLAEADTDNDTPEDTTEGVMQDGEEEAAAEDTTEAAAEPDDSAEDTTKAQQEAPDKGDDGQKFTLKILGREREVGLAELLVLAQKGGDYDRVREGYDAMKTDAMLLRDLAAEAGQEVAEFVAAIRAGSRAQAVDKLAQELTEGGIDENAARMLAEQKMVNRELLASINKPAAPAAEEHNTERGSAVSAADGNAAEVAESVRKLVAAGVDKLPDEVVQLSVDKGLLPFEAWQQWQMDKLAAEKAELANRLAQAERQAKAVAKSPGSMGGSGGEMTDDFLKGLLG